MKCKICGGEISFESGFAVCKSCNTQQKIDHVFEDVDVMICYIENDPSGRRTKDSLIAQELYQKLEAGKINAFYERVSAANSIGDDLELLRYSFMNKAKIIIVVGTSVENFNAIVEKYGQYFSDKMIMPVCTDINPSDIPKELSQYQALDYSSIGWEKDLQKAVLRILGREKEIDLLETHNKSKKLRIVIISSIIAVVLIVAGALLLLYLNNSNSKEDTSDVSTTVAPLTNQQIYENAQSLVVEGKYLEAVELYLQILDYKDSEKQIKKIYDRYDGYYQDEKSNCSLYINVIEAKTVEFSFEKTINQKIVKAEDVLTLDNNQIVGTYIDNFLNEGKISISLSNEHISLSVTTEVKSDDLCFGNVNIQFNLSDKSDRPPIKAVTKELLLSWVESLTYVDDIKAAGYELEFIPQKGEIKEDYGIQYKIANTDIVIVTTDNDLTKYAGEFVTDAPKLENSAVVAIVAPTSLICPEKIGMEAKVFSNEELVFVPNVNFVKEMYNAKSKLFVNFFVNGSVSYSSNSTESRIMDVLTIESESMIGITSKKIIGEYNYNTIITENENIYYRTLVMQKYKDENSIDSDTGRYYIKILSEKEELLLVCIHDFTKGTYNYYKLNINTEKSSFITEHNEDSYINRYGSTTYNYEKWKSYPEIFGEFLPDTWEELNYDAMERITTMKVREKYGLDEDSWISYTEIAQNDTHVLIAIQTDDLEQVNKCAWYKADRYKVSVSFIKEGVYVEDYYELPKHLWFKEYSDFAKEFPSVHSDLDKSSVPYLQNLPYSITIDSGYFSIYSVPAYDNENIKVDEDGYTIYLEDGTYTIVEEQYDDEYNLWGKLESGEGWICLSENYN